MRLDYFLVAMLESSVRGFVGGAALRGGAYKLAEQCVRLFRNAGNCQE